MKKEFIELLLSTKEILLLEKKIKEPK